VYHCKLQRRVSYLGEIGAGGGMGDGRKNCKEARVVRGLKQAGKGFLHLFAGACFYII